MMLMMFIDITYAKPEQVWKKLLMLGGTFLPSDCNRNLDCPAPSSVAHYPS